MVVMQVLGPTTKPSEEEPPVYRPGWSCGLEPGGGVVMERDSQAAFQQWGLPMPLLKVIFCVVEASLLKNREGIWHTEY